MRAAAANLANSFLLEDQIQRVFVFRASFGWLNLFGNPDKNKLCFTWSGLVCGRGWLAADQTYRNKNDEEDSMYG